MKSQSKNAIRFSVNSLAASLGLAVGSIAYAYFQPNLNDNAATLLALIVLLSAGIFAVSLLTLLGTLLTVFINRRLPKVMNDIATRRQNDASKNS